MSAPVALRVFRYGALHQATRAGLGCLLLAVAGAGCLLVGAAASGTELARWFETGDEHANDRLTYIPNEMSGEPNQAIHESDADAEFFNLDRPQTAFAGLLLLALAALFFRPVVLFGKAGQVAVREDRILWTRFLLLHWSARWSDVAAAYETRHPDMAAAKLVIVIKTWNPFRRYVVVDGTLDGFIHLYDLVQGRSRGWIEKSTRAFFGF